MMEGCTINVSIRQMPNSIKRDGVQDMGFTSLLCTCLECYCSLGTLVVGDMFTPQAVC